MTPDAPQVGDTGKESNPLMGETNNCPNVLPPLRLVRMPQPSLLSFVLFYPILPAG